MHVDDDPVGLVQGEDPEVLLAAQRDPEAHNRLEVAREGHVAQYVELEVPDARARVHGLTLGVVAFAGVSVTWMNLRPWTSTGAPLPSYASWRT